MASRLFTRSPIFVVGLASASALVFQATSPISHTRFFRQPLLCEAHGQSPYRTPLLSSGPGSKGGLNPAAVRQISLGSVLGLASGLAISSFSKPLTIIFGLFIVSVQYIESQLGIKVIPRDTIQRWFKDIDVKKTIEGNVPFKVSYGLALLLAGWGRFGSI